MHRLKVKGFLGIKSAEINLDGMTVIIGAQASGKSVIARLIYFFNEYFADFDTTAVANNEHKKTFDSRKKNEFYQIFPQYSWENDEFTLIYSNDSHKIEMRSSQGSTALTIETSPSVATYFRSLKATYKQFMDEFDDDAVARLSRTRLLFEFRDYMAETSTDIYQPALFVPAARSFYATIRDEIFSILALDEKIDKIILQFGEFYEAQKNFTRRRRSSSEDQYFDRIVKGRFVRSDGRDWLVMKRGRIELGRASSGQQEAVPLLFAISRFPRYGRTLIIEEPEAHLFPASQVEVLNFMIDQCVSHETNILFTTHSPYLLSALNNHLLRQMVTDDGIGKERVNAYALENGTARQLLGDDGLVCADYIDGVSEGIEEEFTSLIEKMYENE